MSKIHEVSKLGQSIWYDYIRRLFLTSSELQALIDEGLHGLTSNPTIFEKAIAGSADYDDDLKRLVEEGLLVEDVYEALALDDIARAADLFRPVYESTDGLDGYVSLEVSPTLAHDTTKTIAEALRLFAVLRRPNVMIKVPATPAGIPAITTLIGSGLNVNVTLLFSVENYKAVAGAYIQGLEQLAALGPTVEGGHTVDTVASVASFFVSRVDTAIDAELKKLGNEELLGTIAIANTKVAYAEFQNIFRGARWDQLIAKGARVQRLLWGSTGTKNPLYPDTLYIDALIGPETVNTAPPATVRSFLDHGTAALTLTEGVDEANDRLARLSELGIDLDVVTQRLQEDGVVAFVQSFESLMAAIAEKRDWLLADKRGYSASLGDLQSEVDQALTHITENNIMSRIWGRDHTVWREEPTEISNRLGWLHSPEVMMEAVPEITAFVDEVRAAGYTHALLLGMGGSSLAPEVFRFTFGVKDGYLDLAVLDSTDPGAVLAHANAIDPARTLFIVSTKSGTTVETISFMKYFYYKMINVVGAEQAGDHFVAITDPGSGLEYTAMDLNFKKIFLNDPTIGGRFSALSYFGLVPAALIGVDLTLLLNRAMTMVCNAEGCNCPVAGDNTAAWLGTIMGQLATRGRDKVTLVVSPPIAHFGAWVEQLIAESIGKEGKGIVPVVGEAMVAVDAYAHDRLFVYLHLEGDETYDASVQALQDSGYPVVHLILRDRYDLGGEFFRWEMATAVAGVFLGINPFDQPNVEAAKALARQMVATYQEEGNLLEPPPSFEASGITVYADGAAASVGEALKDFLARAHPRDGETADRSYVSLQAYVNPTPETDAILQELRTKIQTHLKMATTVGYGPRFLHSTGQLHKGDAGHGLFIQFTAEMPEDVGIPDEAGSHTSSISFGVLKRAQALGDRRALLDAGRNVIWFHLGSDPMRSLKTLSEALA